MKDNLEEQIKTFFNSKEFAVVGASSDRNKYGNKVLRCYLHRDKIVYPVNNHEKQIEGILCVSAVRDLSLQVASISIVTPPQITEEIVIQAIKKGITNIWMQPGADNEKAVSICQEKGINVIFGGPCILVNLKFKDLVDK